MLSRLIPGIFALLVTLQAHCVAKADDALALFSADGPLGSRLYITDGTISGTRVVSGIPSEYMATTFRNGASLPGAAAITTAIPTSSGAYSLYLFDHSGVSTRAFISKQPIDILSSIGRFLYFVVIRDDGKRLLYELTIPSNVIRKVMLLDSDMPQNTRVFGFSNDVCVFQMFSLSFKVEIKCLNSTRNSFEGVIDWPGLVQEIYVIGSKVIFNCTGCEGYSLQTRPFVLDFRYKTIRHLFPPGTQLWNADLGTRYAHVTFHVMNGAAYFVVMEEKGNYLWKTDGTPAGTRRASSFNLSGYFYGVNTLASNGVLYIPLWRYIPNSQSFELVSTDGTNSFKRHYFYEGSFRVKMHRDVYQIVGNQIYFVGMAAVSDPNTIDSAIYRADLLTSQATLLVNKNRTFVYDDINGATAAYDEGLQFRRVGSRVIFMLGDGEYFSRGLGSEYFPWITNGYPQGTFMLKDVNMSWDDIQLNEFIPLGPVPKSP